MSLARRGQLLSPQARVIPGSQSLPMDVVDPRRVGDATEVETDTTEEAARLMGYGNVLRKQDDDEV
jgi:hypothetical protein